MRRLSVLRRFVHQIDAGDRKHNDDQGERALLQAVLKRHLESVTEAVGEVCQREQRRALAYMATALVPTFLDAKTRDVKTSVVLYSVSSDVDALRIVRQTGRRFNRRSQRRWQPRLNHC